MNAQIICIIAYVYSKYSNLFSDPRLSPIAKIEETPIWLSKFKLFGFVFLNYIQYVYVSYQNKLLMFSIIIFV